MDFIKETFNEDEWCIYLVDDDDDDLTSNAAEVFFDKREVYVKRSDINLINIRHELWHVYLGYCFIDDANLEQNQMEEVTAALYSHKGKHIDKRAEDIYKKLKVLRDTKKEE